MNIKLSKRIKELRKQKGYTQKEFADFIGVGQTTIANYEKGLRVPDTEKLNKIADYFQVTLDYLLGREEKDLTTNRVEKVTTCRISYNDGLKVTMEYLLNGQKELAKEVIMNFYNEGLGIKNIYFQLIEKILITVGTLWEQGVIDVWMEHYISETLLDIMRELMSKESEQTHKKGYILALTSGPEMHNIGLKMIADILQLEGWNVAYLGSNVPVQSVISAIKFQNPDAIMISATLSYHIESVKNIACAIKSHFAESAPRIIIGGAAFLNSLNPCKETGADYYGKSLEDVKNYIETIN